MRYFCYSFPADGRCRGRQRVIFVSGLRAIVKLSGWPHCRYLCGVPRRLEAPCLSCLSRSHRSALCSWRIPQLHWLSAALPQRVLPRWGRARPLSLCPRNSETTTSSRAPPSYSRAPLLASCAPHFTAGALVRHGAAELFGVPWSTTAAPPNAKLRRTAPPESRAFVAGSVYGDDTEQAWDAGSRRLV